MIFKDNSSSKPKEFPIMLKKVGSWIGTINRYFTEIQKDIVNMETDIENDISSKNKNLNKIKDLKDE